MKLGKLILTTVLSFLGIASTIVYTSCNDDPCYELKCRNGGTCANGYCNCPNGYEGGQCENITAKKYLGKFYGVTKLNNDPVVIDSAVVELVNNTTISAHAFTQRDVINGTIKGLDEIIASPDAKNTGAVYGAVSIEVENNWDGRGDNSRKLILYVEKTVDNQKYVYTFTGQTRID